MDRTIMCAVWIDMGLNSMSKVQVRLQNKMKKEFRVPVNLVIQCVTIVLNPLQM